MNLIDRLKHTLDTCDHLQQDDRDAINEAIAELGAKLEPQLPPAVIQEAAAALEYVMNSVIGRDETHWQYSNIDDAIKALRALLSSPPSPNEEPKA